MNIFCNSNGVIFHVIPEKIFQGSAGVNKVYFIGQFPSSAQVLMAYTLPNGIPTSPKMLILNKQMEEVQAPNGGKFSVWEGVIGASPKIADGQVVKDDSGNVVYDLDFTITENYGIATMQFYVYGASNRVTAGDSVLNVQGGLLATASVNFTIEKGVPVVLPVSLDEEGDVSIILAQVLNALANTQMLYSNTLGEIERVSTNASKEAKAYYDANKADIDANKADIDAHKVDIEVLEAQSEVHTNNIEILSGVVYQNKADIKGLRSDIQNEAHFRGYLQTNAEVQSLQGTPNDYAYSAESGTVWIYQNGAWVNSGKTVPDQMTPASNTTPLMDGTPSAGQQESYARGDHRHPTDTSRLAASEKGQANGVASLDENGKVPAEQLPEGIGGGLPEGFNPEDYVKFTDYATENNPGVGKVSPNFGIGLSGDGFYYIIPAYDNEVTKQDQYSYKALLPRHISKVVKVGITTNTETLTDEEKTSACDWIGAVKKDASVATNLSPLVYTNDTARNHYLATTHRDYVAYNIPMLYGGTAGKDNVNAYLLTATPVNDYHCANKKYVDGALSLIESTVSITIEGTSTENYTANVPAYRKNDPFAYIGAVCVDDSNHLIIGFSKSNNTFIVRDIETGETFKCESWNINE